MFRFLKDLFLSLFLNLDTGKRKRVNEKKAEWVIAWKDRVE